MKRALLLLLLILTYSYNYGQEEIDSSHWQQVIPYEDFNTDKQVGNIIRLTRSDLLSMAGSRDDPSRLLLRFPGITNFEEGNNGIVYRGLPSHYSGWSINGAEILNPNHLNTGGISDSRDLSSAGRANSLSSQIIGEYSYHTITDNDISNSYLAGISNVTLRTPYRNQVNLHFNQNFNEVGIDLRKNKLSLLTNYRDSKKYLLQSLPLGIEKDTADYHDFTCKLGYTNPKGWSFELFHLYGQSNKQKITYTSSGIRETNYKNTISISGLNITKETAQSLLESTTNFSEKLDDQITRRVDLEYTNSDTIRLLSHNTSFTRFYNKTQIEYNLKANLSNFENQRTWSLNSALKNILIQPGMFITYSPTARLHFNAGVQFNYLKVMENEQTEKTLNPSIGVNWISKDYRYKIYGNYNTKQQFQHTPYDYIEYYFPKSQNLTLGINDSRSNLTATLFLNHLSSLSQSSFSFSYLSVLQDESLTSFNDFFNLFSNNSTAQIYGLSIDYHEELNQNTVLTGNITMQKGKQYFNFDSLSTLATATTKIPLLSDLIGNLTFSKKQLWSQNLDLEISTHFRSARNYKQGYDDDLDRKIPYYFRSDLRLNYHIRKKGRRYTSLLSLDIQNLTGHKNGVFYKYDYTIKESILHSTDRILPTISWRVVI